MDRNEVIELFKQIKMFYPNFEVTTDRVNAWYNILEKYEFNNSVRNLKKFIETSKFAPTIADLIEGQYKDSRPYDNTPNVMSDEELAEVKKQNEQFKKEHGVYPHEYYAKEFRKISRQ